METVWFARAGEGGVLFDCFLKNNCMAIGLNGTKDFSQIGSKDDVENHIKETPNDSFSDNRTYGETLAKNGWRFFNDMQVGDIVLLVRNKNVEAIGIVQSDYRFEAEPNWQQINPNPGYCHIRTVDWVKLKEGISNDGIHRRLGFGAIKPEVVANFLSNIDKLKQIGLDRLILIDLLSEVKEDD